MLFQRKLLRITNEYGLTLINLIITFIEFRCGFNIAAQELETIKKQYVKIVDAYGCLGVLQVNAGESSVLYLVLVTGCISMGKICDSEIFRITQTQFVPLQFQAPGEDKIAEVMEFWKKDYIY